MIVIQKDTNNLVVLSLTNRTLQSPYYLFQFTNEQTGEEILFNSTDESSYQCRYNSFSIIETGSTFTNLSAGTITVDMGSWEYNIFESSTPTLVISGTTGTAIDNGKVVILGNNNFFTATTIDSRYW